MRSFRKIRASSRPVRQLRRHRRAHVNHYGHVIVVRGAKHPSNLRDVCGIVVVDDGVSEVQLEAPAKVRISRAAHELLECVVLQRVETTESDQPIGKLRHLPAGPVVLASELLRGRVNLTRRLFEDVGRRQHDRTLDPRRIELLDEVGCSPRLHRCDRRRRRHQRRKLRAEQVLMVIGERC